MKKKRGQKHHESRKYSLIFAEKLEMFGLMGFIFALFLLDVNANLIGAYGNAIPVNLLFGKTVPATFMFWLGILFLGSCLFILATRTLYHPLRKHHKLDIFGIIIGTIGMMIILSGGMLLFWHDNSLIIPVFKWNLTRISYYHFGIVFEVLAAFYFGLIK